MSIVPLSRANNISIMLTQFSNFRRGPQDIRRAVCAGELGPERLSLLLQVLFKGNGNPTLPAKISAPADRGCMTSAAPFALARCRVPLAAAAGAITTLHFGILRPALVSEPVWCQLCG